MIYSIIDVETTGGSPKSSKITEIAIYRHDGEKIIDEFVSLVNPEMPIPEFVANLTGITDEMVVDAPKFHEIAKRIVEITDGTIFVAHNVGFDYGMIRKEFKSLGYDFRIPHLCTVVAARQYLPGQDSYSLGKLTRALGIKLVGRHRAGGDALATVKLFELILAAAKEDIEKSINLDINPRFLHPALDIDAIEELPNKTGVYKFFNEKNELIYLGKAKYVRTSILQHLKNSSVKKSAQWCSEITHVQIDYTGIELIASILEHQLLKQGKPLHNVVKRKTTLIEPTLFPLVEGERFYLLGKGRNKQEKCLLLIENGYLSGYGFAPFHLNRLTPVYWKKFIQFVEEDSYTQQLSTAFLKTTKLEKIYF